VKRLLAAALAPALALGLVLTATPANAAGVKETDLPSMGQVSATFPDLTEATRTVNPTPKVGYMTSCKRAKPLRTQSGLTGTYFDVNATVMVNVQTVQMKSIKNARTVLQGNRLYSKCKKVTADGVTITVKPLKAPKVGQERVGFTTTLATSGDSMVADNYVLRKNGRVITVSVIYMGQAPQRATAAKLVKKAYQIGL
jgi:hypothetical protein